VALACNEAGAVNKFVFGTEGHVAHWESVYTKIVRRGNAALPMNRWFRPSA
jgi:hypothetical protein